MIGAGGSSVIGTPKAAIGRASVASAIVSDAIGRCSATATGGATGSVTTSRTGGTAIGASVAIKAAGIHATYLVDGEKEKLARYESLAALAEEAIAALPGEANSHYRRAFAIGRYSQCISITKALAQGLAGKVKESLDATLELAPKHAEAQTALGLYHAEIVGKVGGMLAKLTYGASAAIAEKHLTEATRLTPASPIAWIELGNGLLLLHGDKREDAVAEAYSKAAKVKPRDAMEALDVAWAKDQLA